MSIGGKWNCDQITVTCDYFTGEIDYVRIERAGGGGAPVNQAPQARFASSCEADTCTLDSSQSSDPDGATASVSHSVSVGTVPSSIAYVASSTNHETMRDDAAATPRRSTQGGRSTAYERTWAG